MSCVIGAFYDFIDQGVDAFFKKVLMVEEIPELRQYKEKTNSKIPKAIPPEYSIDNSLSQNFSDFYNSKNDNSHSHHGHQNLRKADPNTSNNRNQSVFDSDNYSSNENNPDSHNNVFSKLAANGNNDKEKKSNFNKEESKEIFFNFKIRT